MIKLRTDGVSRTVNPASPLRIAPIVGCALIVFLLFSPLAMGETKIQEVQPWPPNAPTQLIIWGTGFGDIDPVLDTPMILFGTESTNREPPRLNPGPGKPALTYSSSAQGRSSGFAGSG